MKIRKILDWLDNRGFAYDFTGNEDVEITGFSSLASYAENTITWLKEETIYDTLGRPSHIACAVVQTGVKVEFNNVISTDVSKEMFFSILSRFWGEKRCEGSIGIGTVISEEAVIDPTVSIGCNCSIVGNVVIGPHTVIEHNVVLQGKVSIGQNCHIQSGVVIGISGYGYSQDPQTKCKTMVEHFGGVRVGNDVFIGSHVNIARGTIDDTVIGNGVKIAPFTHIGHNNFIEDDVSIICSNLYGSVRIGEGAYITASTIQNQMRVGKDTVIGMGSVVTKPIREHMIAYGIPAREMKENNSGL